MSTEAWKDTGDCRECRRKPYCKKVCAAHKRRAYAIAKGFVESEKTGRLYPALPQFVQEGRKNG